MADQVRGLPVVARPDMDLQVRVGVAEDLQIHPSEGGIVLPASFFDGLAQIGHRGKEPVPRVSGQIRESAHGRVVGE